MEKIKRFIECYLPVTACNFRCHYCYITQQRLFDTKIEKLKFTSEYIAKSLSKKRLGGTCFFNICAGGETMLSSDLVQLVENLLKEGHFVGIVTNGSISKRIDEIILLNKTLLKQLYFKFSFQYLELIRLNLLDKFVENIKKIKLANISFTIEITPNDELIPLINDIKNFSLEKFGALPHITIARDDRDESIPILSKYLKKDFYKIWSQFESEMLDFKFPIFGEKRKEFCYAGEWSFYLDLGSGDIRKCYCEKRIGNIFKRKDEKIRFESVGHKCSLSHCYNAHSFLLFGDIPELNTPTYADIRNRKCSDGTQWLQPEMKHFFSSKLVESNKEYNVFRKSFISFKSFLCEWRKLVKIKGKLVAFKLRRSVRVKSLLEGGGGQIFLRIARNSS